MPAYPLIRYITHINTSLWSTSKLSLSPPAVLATSPRTYAPQGKIQSAHACLRIPCNHIVISPHVPMAQHCRSATLRGYREAVNFLSHAQNYPIPAKFATKDNMLATIFENLKNEEVIVSRQRSPLTSNVLPNSKWMQTAPTQTLLKA